MNTLDWQIGTVIMSLAFVGMALLCDYWHGKYFEQIERTQFWIGQYKEWRDKYNDLKNGN